MAILKGKWQFIENISPALVDFKTLYSPVNIMFQSNDVNYTGFKYNTDNNFFSYMESSTEQQDVFDDLLHKWVLPEYKIVHFLEEQNVDQYFYNWFTSIATELVVPEIENIRLVNTADLILIADSLRAKDNRIRELEFPTGYKNAIDNLELNVVSLTESNQEIIACATLEKLEIPHEINNISLSTTLNTYNKQQVWERMAWSTKKIIIPDYFTVATIGAAFGNLWYSALEEVECGATQFTFNGQEVHVNLHTVKAPNATGTVAFKIQPVPPNGTTILEEHKRVVAIAPRASTIELQIGRSNNIVELISDFTDCTTFGVNARNLNNGRFWTGTIDLPNCETITYTYPDVGEATLYLPKLQQFTNYFMNNAQTSGGIVHLYVGPDLSNLSNINATWWATYSSHVDFHIPPGDSTTKQMLDGEGIPYTQDYVI